MKRAILSVPVGILMTIGLILVGLALIPFGLAAILIGKDKTIGFLNGIKFTTNKNEGTSAKAYQDISTGI